jgi:hypothetical protein
MTKIEIDLTPQGRTHLRQNCEQFGDPLVPGLLDALEKVEAERDQAQAELKAANEALDKVTEHVQPNDGHCWSDADGLLESIGNTVENTGRTVHWNGVPYDEDEDDDWSSTSDLAEPAAG